MVDILRPMEKYILQPFGGSGSKVALPVLFNAIWLIGGELQKPEIYLYILFQSTSTLLVH